MGIIFLYKNYLETLSNDYRLNCIGLTYRRGKPDILETGTRPKCSSTFRPRLSTLLDRQSMSKQKCFFILKKQYCKFNDVCHGWQKKITQSVVINFCELYYTYGLVFCTINDDVRTCQKGGYTIVEIAYI